MSLAAMVALSLGACGSGASASDEESRVREAVTAYFQAVDAPDGAAICGRLTDEAQRAIGDLQSASCERALSEAARQLPGSFNDYRLGGASVEGDEATVELQATGVADEVVLERVGEQWKIADAPGLGIPSPGASGAGAR